MFVCFLWCAAPNNLNDSVVSGAGTEEDGEDVEYNYLDDQAVEEKEEFRDDRAVRISSECVGVGVVWGCVVISFLFQHQKRRWMIC